AAPGRGPFHDRGPPGVRLPSGGQVPWAGHQRPPRVVLRERDVRVRRREDPARVVRDRQGRYRVLPCIAWITGPGSLPADGFPAQGTSCGITRPDPFSGRVDA